MENLLQYRFPRNALQELPPMVSATDIKNFLSCSRSAALRLVERLPCIDIAAPGAKKRMLRVPRNELYKFLSQNVQGETFL